MSNLLKFIFITWYLLKGNHYVNRFLSLSLSFLMIKIMLIISRMLKQTIYLSINCILFQKIYLFGLQSNFHSYYIIVRWLQMYRCLDYNIYNYQKLNKIMFDYNTRIFKIRLSEWLSSNLKLMMCINLTYVKSIV